MLGNTRFVGGVCTMLGNTRFIGGVCTMLGNTRFIGGVYTMLGNTRFIGGVCTMLQARIQKLKEGGAEWIARAAREIFCNHAHSAV